MTTLKTQLASPFGATTWGIYQRMIAAYRDPDRARGRELMHQLGGVQQVVRAVADRGRDQSAWAVGLRDPVDPLACSLGLD